MAMRPRLETFSGEEQLYSWRFSPEERPYAHMEREDWRSVDSAKLDMYIVCWTSSPSQKKDPEPMAANDQEWGLDPDSKSVGRG